MRRSSSQRHNYSSMARDRQQVAADHRYVFELPLADFLDDSQLVPPYPVGVDLDELTNANSFEDPQRIDAGERTCFEPLIDAWNEVLHTAQNQIGREPTLFAIQCPNTTLSGPDDWFNKSPPNAVLMLTSLLDAKDDWRSALSLFDGTNHYLFDNVVLPMRFKTNPNNDGIADNRTKLLWDLNHILREDDRRTHSYGLTFEGRTVRLWLASRSAVLVSSEHDWVSNPRLLIDIICRLSFSSPSYLGYDDSVELDHSCDEEKYYIYRIGDERYRTRKVLASSHGKNLISGGTRVILVRKLLPDGTESEDMFVMKDYWPHDKRTRELDTYNTIQERIKSLNESDQKFAEQVFKDHVMPVIKSVTIPVVEAVPHFLQPSTAVLANTNCIELLPSEKETSFEKEIRAFFGRATSPPPAVEFRPRRHDRLLYGHLGLVYHTEPTLSRRLIALRDTAKVLRVLGMVEYVHRDISPNNIYIVGEPPRGMVGDWEYAVLAGSKPTMLERMGTHHFAATEVGMGTFFMRAPFSIPYNSAQPEETESKYLISPDWQQSLYHDAESLLWILTDTYKLVLRASGYATDADKINQFMNLELGSRGSALMRHPDDYRFDPNDTPQVGVISNLWRDFRNTCFRMLTQEGSYASAGKEQYAKFIDEFFAKVVQLFVSRVAMNIDLSLDQQDKGEDEEQVDESGQQPPRKRRRKNGDDAPVTTPYPEGTSIQNPIQ